jgi:hypothetical protein
MSNLHPGISVCLKCLGSIEGPRFLDGNTSNGIVGLAPNTNEPFSGTRWTVADDGNSRLLLRCMGKADGGQFFPNARFLDGRTHNGTVGLAPHPDLPFSGAHWEATDDGPGRVILKGLGFVEGPRFLDGRTHNGTVGLASRTDGGFTGTHWLVVNPAPIDSLQLDAGNLTVPGSLPLRGNATLVINRNGDFSLSTHVRDSGFDPIKYVVSAVLAAPTPGGTAVTFQHSGDVGGTTGGGPRNDDHTVTGNNGFIRDHWGTFVASSYSAAVDGEDQFPFGSKGALQDLIKQMLQELAKQAVQEVIAAVTA